MKLIRAPFFFCAATMLFCAAANGQTGYWQYVKTDSYIRPYAVPTAYPDTHVGPEGNFSVTLSEPSLNPAPTLGTTFNWAPPPAILIPNTALYWPVSAYVDKSVPGRFLNLSFTAEMYPYQPVSNLATADPWASSVYATVATDYSMPVGTTVRYNNALITTPTKIPAGSSVWMDANGLMTIIVWIKSSSTYYWSYVYHWVPGAAMGSCAGTCTLASPGQNIGQTGGPGSVAITATSTWDVIVVDPWIKLTSPTTGASNSSVTFTADPNTGPPRIGTIIIGGQPYTIYQDGTGAPTPGPQGGLDLHRPKLVVTDTSGNTFTLQPAPGRNDGTDDGSPNAGKDTGVFGQSSGGWPDHNFGKDSPVYVMTSTCNNSTGYAYLQFSLASLPTQNIASAKALVYAGSTVVSGLSPNSADPVFAARRVTSSWDKSRMTWNSGQPTYDSTIIDSQTLSGVAGNRTAVSGWLSYDITTLYKGWASGSTPNYGLRFSHENGQCMNGWLGTFATSNDQPPAQTGSACTYSLSLSAASAPAAGGSGAFTVNASAATCGWTASTSTAWIHVINGTSGNGSGTVSYTVDGNTGSSRSGTITLTGGGQTFTFTVAQAGGGGSPVGPTSTCTGTCSLGAPGQTMGVNIGVKIRIDTLG